MRFSQDISRKSLAHATSHAQRYMYNSEEQMQHIMQAPQLTPDEKVKLYDQTL